MLRKRHWVFVLPLLAIFLSACPWWEPLEEPAPMTEYTPIFMTRPQLEASIKSQTPRKLQNPGKIILYQNYIFLNEKYEGIHVIDNTNPSNPQKVTFISVPGCIDMTIRTDRLVVDNAVDLVVLDISTINQISELTRKANTFPEMNPPDLGELPEEYKIGNRQNGLIIVGWEKK